MSHGSKRDRLRKALGITRGDWKSIDAHLEEERVRLAKGLVAERAAMADTCSARHPKSQSIKCELPPGHSGPHQFGEGATRTKSESVVQWSGNPFEQGMEQMHGMIGAMHCNTCGHEGGMRAGVPGYHYVSEDQSWREWERVPERIANVSIHVHGPRDAPAPAREVVAEAIEHGALQGFGGNSDSKVLFTLPCGDVWAQDVDVLEVRTDAFDPPEDYERHFVTPENRARWEDRRALPDVTSGDESVGYEVSSEETYADEAGEIGVAPDDLLKYVELRKQGKTPEQAVEYLTNPDRFTPPT